MVTGLLEREIYMDLSVIDRCWDEALTLEVSRSDSENEGESRLLGSGEWEAGWGEFAKGFYFEGARRRRTRGREGARERERGSKGSVELVENIERA